jgi:hypothetical protein
MAVVVTPPNVDIATATAAMTDSLVHLNII